MGRGAQLPQPPAVSYTQQQERLGLAPQAPAGQARPGVGLIPGALRVAERVAPILQRLFNREPLPTERRPGEPTAGARFAPIFSQEQVARGFQGIGTRLAEIRASRFRDIEGVDFAEGFPRGSFPDPGKTTYTAGELAAQQAEAATGSIRPDPFTGLYQQRFGIPTVGGEAQGYILGNFRDAEGNLIELDEDMKRDIERQKARNKSQLLNLGERPLFISNAEREYMGLSEDQMRAIGYEWDEESQQWIHSGVIEDPQTYGAAAPYGGDGYPGGGYGTPRGGGGGGGAWSYPSYLPRENQPYPQSFVRQGARGMTPEQARNSAARFGAINWRI